MNTLQKINTLNKYCLSHECCAGECELDDITDEFGIPFHCHFKEYTDEQLDRALLIAGLTKGENDMSENLNCACSAVNAVHSCLDPLAYKVERHDEICKQLNKLYAKKNHDYNDSFAKSFAKFGMYSPCMRLDDKLNRLVSLIEQEAQVVDESIDDTLVDIANYAIMTLIERRLREERALNGG